MNAKVKLTAAECLKVINDAANESRHRGEYERANNLVNARARLASLLREREQSAGEAVSVPCPYPCDWKELHSMAVHDYAYIARNLNTDEPVTEEARQRAFNLGEMLKTVCRAMLASAPTAPADEEEDHA